VFRDTASEAVKRGGVVKVTTINRRPPGVLLTANYTCFLLACTKIH